ncbi:MAG: Clp protease ClpP [Ruminococcus flavefaciens]|nr:Clp protease ClpP [Ruminococcus flavefaciens]MCM1062080.1 Clp protease ClpP [Eubacterium sp.]
MTKFWNFVKNEETSETELYFEGPISNETWWGDELTPKIFKDELAKHPGDLTIWLCSPGGDVFAASQIYTMLRNHKSKVTVKIDGIAASAASVVAMAGDETLISPTGYLMIHNPMTLASGNKSDMEKAIALLEEIKEGIINAYVRKTGLSRNKISKLMDDETWLNAEKALQLGFVDGILFDEKKKPITPEENEPDEDEPDEKSKEDDSDEDEENLDKPQKNTTSMLYSPTKTTASLMQKISAMTPKGVPINQLEKRLALLKN